MLVLITCPFSYFLAKGVKGFWYKKGRNFVTCSDQVHHQTVVTECMHVKKDDKDVDLMGGQIDCLCLVLWKKPWPAFMSNWADGSD